MSNIVVNSEKLYEVLKSYSDEGCCGRCVCKKLCDKRDGPTCVDILLEYIQSKEYKTPCQVDRDASCDGCKERMECGMGGSENDVVFEAKHTSDGVLADTRIPKSKTFYDITHKMCETYVKRNKDYGDSFGKSFEQWGIIAGVIRMQDKMNRIASLVKSGSQEVKDESIKDTLLDLANYAVMTLVEME